MSITVSNCVIYVRALNYRESIGFSTYIVNYVTRNVCIKSYMN